jgi:glycosyltransferase involved in cell wall biosynthesis
VAINGLHSKSGGGVTYLNNILPHLAKDPGLELHLVLHAAQRREYEHLAEAAQLHIVDFPSGLVRMMLWEQTTLPRMTRRLGADVVYSPANYGPLFARRTVLLVRNALAVGGQEARIGKIAYWVAMTMMTLVSVAAARKVIAVSNYAIKGLFRGPLKGLRRKVTVINHGISPLFQPHRDGAGCGLLAVGDIYIQKNYHTLLKAFRQLLDGRPDLTLTIAGQPIDADYAAGLRDAVGRMGLDRNVVFLGRVPPAELNRLYQSCEVFVFPSTVETFGNPLVEALACGTPTACSNTAAMPEIAGDAVEYFDPTDAGSMQGAIDRLLKDEARRRELSARAVERAAEFSWEKSARRLAAVLKQAAS